MGDAGGFVSSLQFVPSPRQPPPAVQLGRNCRAMVLSWKLRPDAVLKDLTLETLSQEVVIGLMGVSLIDAHGLSSADDDNHERRKPKDR